MVHGKEKDNLYLWKGIMKFRRHHIQSHTGLVWDRKSISIWHNRRLITEYNA